MSAQHTGDWMYALLTPIFGPIDPHRFEVFHFLLRKTGHFVGYGILSLLTFRALTNQLFLHPRANGRLIGSFQRPDRISGRVAPDLHSFSHRLVQDVLLDTVAAACVRRQ